MAAECGCLLLRQIEAIAETSTPTPDFATACICNLAVVLFSPGAAEDCRIEIRCGLAVHESQLIALLCQQLGNISDSSFLEVLLAGALRGQPSRYLGQPSRHPSQQLHDGRPSGRRL